MSSDLENNDKLINANGAENGNGVGSLEEEDDDGGEFIVIEKKHNRGNKARMKQQYHHHGNGGGPKHKSFPLSSLPYHPHNLRRQNQQRDQQNGNNNHVKDKDTTESVTSSNSSVTSPPPHTTTWASVISSGVDTLPSTSSHSAPSSTLSVASGPTSNSGDDASSTAGNANHESDLQADLEEITKPKFVEAPPPRTNPWKVYNAASVIMKTGNITKQPSNKPSPSVSNRSSPGLSVTSNAPRNSYAAPNSNAPKSSAMTNGEEWPSIDQAISGKPVSWSAIAIGAHNNGNNCNVSLHVSRSNKATQAPVVPDGMARYWATLPYTDGPAVADETDNVVTTKTNGADFVAPANSSPEEWPSIAQAITKSVSVNNNHSSSGSSRSGSSQSISPPPQTAQNKLSSLPKQGCKPKWVPLALPEPETPKHSPKKKDKERTEKDKSPNSTNQQKRQEGLETSGMPTSSPIPRGGRFGRGGGRGRGGMRGGFSRGGVRQNGYFKDHNGFHHPNGDYTDYPQDFTTLLPAYPTVSEYIVPYVSPSCRVAHLDRPDLTEVNFFVSSVVDRNGLLGLVRKQIEYYFSVENLEKDFYLRRKMDSDGYIPIKLIASFQRVQAMTTDFQAVIEAIQSSPRLEMQDSTFVRTKKDPGKWPIVDNVHFNNVLPVNALSSTTLPKQD